MPPIGRTPSGNPIAVPRSHGFHERFHSSRFMPVKSCSVHDLDLLAPVLPRLVQRLAHGEEAR